MKYIGKIFTWLICGLAVFFVVMMIVMFAFGGDGKISDLAWTEEMISVYEEYPEDFYVEYIKVYNDHYFSDDGYFSVSRSRYIPSCEQWQFTVRYNRSTLEYLGDERGETMEDGKDHFTFAVCDSNGNVYRDFCYKKEIKGRYTYYRLIFDNISIRRVDEMVIKIYCIDDMEGDELPPVAVGKLPLYYPELVREEYKFKKEIPDPLVPAEGFVSGKELLKG